MRTKLLRTYRTEVTVTNFWYLEHTIACLWPYMSTDFNRLFSTHGIYHLERESFLIRIYFVLLIVYDLLDYTVIRLLENECEGRRSYLKLKQLLSVFPQLLRKTTEMFRQENQSVGKDMNFETVGQERRKYSPTSALYLDLFCIWEICARKVCCCLLTFKVDSWKCDRYIVPETSVTYCSSTLSKMQEQRRSQFTLLKKNCFGWN